MRPLATSAAALVATLVLAREARATVYEIGPDDDLSASIAALVAGDELVLAGGTYVLDGYFEIAVSGELDLPIVIRAKEGETPILEQQADQNVVNVLGSYVTLRGLEVTGGSRGIRIQEGDFVTVEDCHVHDTAANAISANDAGVSYLGIVIRHNEIHHTGGNGEGMYLGCNENACQFHDGLIERNWVHDTRGPTVDQGDGIEIKEGSYGNIVRDNVVHDTAYPCIITYSTVGNGAPNIVERNVMWGCGDHGIQSAADVVIRNNVILSAAADGIRNQPHQSGNPGNIEIVHNTVLKAAGDAIRSDGIVGAVLIANNAIYAQAGNAIRVAGDLGGVTVAGNVGMGSLDGVDGGFSATGTLADFVAASFSGTPPNDVFPAVGSALIGAGDGAYVPSNDFNGKLRAGTPDVGAYHFDAGGNPGWTIGAGFKDEVIGGDGDGDGGGGGDGDGDGDGDGGGGGGGDGDGNGDGDGDGDTGATSSVTGAGTGTGAGAGGAGDGASDGEDDGCGCVVVGAREQRGALAFGLAAVAVVVGATRRRRRDRSSRGTAHG